MRNGWTLTLEQLTAEGNVPDVYDIMAEAETELTYVVRQYDTIVRGKVCFSPPPDYPRPDPHHIPPGLAQWDGDMARHITEREDYLRILATEGIIVDRDFDWSDFTLHAADLHARYVVAQAETLPLAV